MASAFGHAAAALAISNLFRLKTKLSLGIILLGIFCSILPDADVISFKFDIPYESMWGHRGISHSILFAVILSGLLAYFLSKTKRQFFAIASFLFLATISHALLDALTTGGEGVAFFAPFDNTRYFLPWRVIQVSPIGLESFFSEWGLRVIKSELRWIGIPFLISFLIFRAFKSSES
jgi:inner membrane protein